MAAATPHQWGIGDAKPFHCHPLRQQSCQPKHLWLHLLPTTNSLQPPAAQPVDVCGASRNPAHPPTAAPPCKTQPNLCTHPAHTHVLTIQRPASHPENSTSPQGTARPGGAPNLPPYATLSTDAPLPCIGGCSQQTSHTCITRASAACTRVASNPAHAIHPGQDLRPCTPSASSYCRHCEQEGTLMSCCRSPHPRSP